MNINDLEAYLDNNQDTISWVIENDHILLRHNQYDKDGEHLSVDMAILPNLTPGQLHEKIIGGRNIDHITRVTGYFSKTSGWNKGKLGELKDRERSEVN